MDHTIFGSQGWASDLPGDIGDSLSAEQKAWVHARMALHLRELVRIAQSPVAREALCDLVLVDAKALRMPSPSEASEVSEVSDPAPESVSEPVPEHVSESVSEPVPEHVSDHEDEAPPTSVIVDEEE